MSPKILRPKIVEENIDNFTAVTKDAIASLVKLKEACGPDGHIPDLEDELSRWATESMFRTNLILLYICDFVPHIL